MTQVIINDTLPYTQIVATAGQTVFATNPGWTVNALSDVQVYQRAGTTPANDVTQLLATNLYTVALIGGDQDVQITLVNPASAGDIITIVRNTPADRENLYTNTNFTPSMLNNDFGILTLVDQQAQLSNQVITPHYNYSELITVPRDVILPALGPNEVWAKNSTNTAIIPVNLSSIVSTGVTEVDTGTGLTGGPIVATGTISFAPIAGNSFWANTNPGLAVPGVTSLSLFLLSANNFSDVPNKSTARTNLGVAIGVDVQAYSPALTSLAGLAGTTNQMLYYTAANTLGLLTPVANQVLISDPLAAPSFASTLPTAVQSNITQLGSQTQALNMGTHQITNVVDPTNPQDAATRAYVDAQTGNFLPITGGTMQGAIDMGSHKITNMTDPSNPQDAVTLSYLSTQINNYLPLSGGTMTGVINMNTHKITGVVDPTNAQDAATKAYVDTFAAGLTVKPACYAASTTALTATYANGASGIGATLTNAGAFAVFALDGTNPTATQRVLIKNQASPLQNGIYTVTNVGDAISVNWVLTRATDYDQPSEIHPGDLIVINNGTTNGGSSWVETDTVTSIGVDSIEFSQFTFSANAVLLKANNLSDVASITTSFNNLSPLTTKGDILTYSTTNTRLAVGLVDGQILQVSSGAATGLAWSTPTYPSASGTLGKFLISDGTNNVYSTSTIPTSAGATANKVLLSDGTNYVLSTPAFPNASATSGKIIVSDGTNWIASTPTFPNASASVGKFIRSDGTNWIASTPTLPVTAGTAGKVLQSDGTNYVESTPTYPSASGTAGKIIRSDGTNNLYSTSTFADTYAINTILYNSSANTVSGLATANSSVLVTSGAGVPSLSTTLPSGLTIPGYAASGANADITSMTGLTGQLKAPTQITDTNNNAILKFSSNASATDYLEIYNSNASGAYIRANGPEASVSLTFLNKNSYFLFGDNSGTVSAQIRLYNAAMSHYTSLSVASAQAADCNLLLPASDGAKNSVMTTNASGTLSFVDSALKVWCNKVGNSTTVNSSLNVSSATHASTGTHVINFTTSFASTNYVTTANSLIAATLQFCMVQSQATGSVSINTYNSSGTLTDPTQLLVMCAGTQ